MKSGIVEKNFYRDAVFADKFSSTVSFFELDHMFSGL